MVMLVSGRRIAGAILLSPPTTQAAALTGTITAQAVAATSSFVGTVEDTGAVVAQAQTATASITATIVVDGTLTAQAQTATASITGGAVAATGTIDAQSQNATASITGTIVVDGVLTAQAQAATASFVEVVVGVALVTNFLTVDNTGAKAGSYTTVALAFAAAVSGDTIQLMNGQVHVIDASIVMTAAKHSIHFTAVVKNNNPAGWPIITRTSAASEAFQIVQCPSIWFSYVHFTGHTRGVIKATNTGAGIAGIRVSHALFSNIVGSAGKTANCIDVVSGENDPETTGARFDHLLFQNIIDGRAITSFGAYSFTAEDIQFINVRSSTGAVTYVDCISSDAAQGANNVVRRIRAEDCQGRAVIQLKGDNAVIEDVFTYNCAVTFQIVCIAPINWVGGVGVPHYVSGNKHTVRRCLVHIPPAGLGGLGCTVLSSVDMSSCTVINDSLVGGISYFYAGKYTMENCVSVCNTLQFQSYHAAIMLFTAAGLGGVGVPDGAYGVEVGGSIDYNAFAPTEDLAMRYQVVTEALVNLGFYLTLTQWKSFFGAPNLPATAISLDVNSVTGAPNMRRAQAMVGPDTDYFQPMTPSVLEGVGTASPTVTVDRDFIDRVIQTPVDMGPMLVEPVDDGRTAANPVAVGIVRSEPVLSRLETPYEAITPCVAQQYLLGFGAPVTLPTVGSLSVSVTTISVKMADDPSLTADIVLTNVSDGSVVATVPVIVDGLTRVYSLGVIGAAGSDMLMTLDTNINGNPVRVQVCFETV